MLHFSVLMAARQLDVWVLVGTPQPQSWQVGFRFNQCRMWALTTMPPLADYRAVAQEGRRTLNACHDKLQPWP